MKILIKLLTYFGFIEKIKVYIHNRIRYIYKSEIKNEISANTIINNWQLMKDLSIEKFKKEIDNNIYLNFYLDSELCKYIYQGNFEQDELEFIKNYLKPGNIFIDIGANIGLFSLIAANQVGIKGKVISFEPTPGIFKRLLENIETNHIKNIEPINIAISNIKGKASFSVSNNGFDAWNSLAEATVGESYDKIEVDCDTIDILYDKEQIPSANLVKIDIEGWELFALQGGRNYFTSSEAPDILIEFTEENAQNAGTSCLEVLKYLEKLGYQMFEYRNGNLNIHIPKTYYPYENLIATKNPEVLHNRILKN